MFNTVTTMHILLYAFLVYVTHVNTALGIDLERRFQVDLIDGLHVYNKSYQGVRPVVGVHSFSPAILLQGEARNLKLSNEVYEKAAKLLSSSNEFTLLATVQQDEKNAGSIISFSTGNNRFLEMQSSARKDEIRLHYTHRGSVIVETFPYRLTDGKWHRLAITVSGNHASLLVDCNRIYERAILDVDRSFANTNLSLWIGQRSSKQFFFKGGLQDVMIISREHGYLMQCPHLDTECPTCGQFRQLQMSVAHLENYIQDLTVRLERSEQRLGQVESCECQRSCHKNGSLHLDGAVWKQGCNICQCAKGDVKCRPVQCPPIQCKNPIHVKGDCCPTCLKQCLLRGIMYDHGEKVSPKPCVDCSCQDGVMHCERLDPESHCPMLTCSPEDQFSVPGECCKFCKGVDYCALGHECHENATCLNLNTRSACQCNKGFTGDGITCHDVDECSRIGGHDGHHCQSNTRCVNVEGTYICECLPGYSKVDTYNCAEHDECGSGQHMCHKNAMCINTEGSYHCQCQPGYEGNGFHCEPVCNQSCFNGGKCIGPGNCACRRGYVGPSCDIDVDECSLGIHQCHPHSRCYNMPGWYYCECRIGYHSFLPDNKMGFLCQDIDECHEGIHTCHGTAKCVNTEGSFHCNCDNDVATCSLSCIFEGVERQNNSIWDSNTELCGKCHCDSGIVSCTRANCSCSDENANFECCPQCDRTTRCEHQELPTLFQNGDRWLYQCQVCECMYGEVDCWPVECPLPECDTPVLAEGDCCPRCEDDPCSSEAVLSENLAGSNTSTVSDTVGQERGCAYMGRFYSSGEFWQTSHDKCTTCKCKNGHLCCSFSMVCTSDSPTTDVDGIHSSTDMEMDMDMGYLANRTVDTDFTPVNFNDTSKAPMNTTMNLTSPTANDMTSKARGLND